MNNILIIAEHNNSLLADSIYKLVDAANKIQDVKNIAVLVAGFECTEIAEKASKINSVNKILLADDVSYKHYLAENMANLILSIADEYNYIIAPSNSFGKDFLPRVAAKLAVPQISDVIEFISNDTFKHPIYAGNAIETVQVKTSKKLLTIRLTSFAASAVSDNDPAEIIKIATATISDKIEYIKLDQTESDRPEITNANIVISGGRGMGSMDNFKLLESVADKLGAAIGASRAAVDAGFAPNDWQVGQTGKIIAPNLYIAVGISGAIQHLAGMKDSRVVVAINKDENAPIFDIADYGIVGDLLEILPEINELLEK
ncbi:MAG: FAD-binding protein [Pseudomonadota bacterium]